jgi:hypothetical protein
VGSISAWSLCILQRREGLAIEAIAASSGVSWGACQWRPALLSCKGVTKATRRDEVGAPWHNPRTVYECENLFTVVRNLYARMLSWFYCPWAGYKGSGPVTPAVLNMWLQANSMKLNTTNSFSGRPQYEYVFDENGCAEERHL